MLRFTIATAAAFATLIGIAPIASADADDLTNVEVVGSQNADVFVPYKVTVPVPVTGGQGPFSIRNQIVTFPLLDEDGLVIGTLTINRGPYDDGLSDSSRDMLDRIRVANATEAITP